MDDLRTRIGEHAGDLTPAERLVAQVVLADPEHVAFSTVARLAARAGTSGATVVRFANRLGYDGFVGLQAAVQGAIGTRLRPATERIREPSASGDGTLARALEVEVANLRTTLSAVDTATFGRAVQLLADPARHVVVLAGDAELGIGTMFATALAMLRDGVEQVAGPDTTVARRLAARGRGDVLLAIDLRRYERWVVTHTEHAVDRGVRLVAITDSALSPLARRAACTFTVAADGIGPFDSHVGTLAVANALVAGVAAARRRPATTRLDRVEASWRSVGALVP